MKLKITIEADVEPCGEDADHDVIIDPRNYENQLRQQIDNVIDWVYKDGAFTQDLPLALTNRVTTVELSS